MTKFLFLSAALLASQIKAASQTITPEFAHARTEFHFTANLPYDQAFPLFGAWAEQKWAPDWKPQFLYPNPPADKEGAVFLVNHGSHSAVWMLTRFDPATGRVQYAFVLNNVIMTRIDIAVRKSGSEKTEVSVAYDWTALDSAANEHVTALAKQLEGAAAEWGGQINSYAAKLNTGK